MADRTDSRRLILQFLKLLYVAGLPLLIYDNLLSYIAQEREPDLIINSIRVYAKKTSNMKTHLSRERPSSWYSH